MGVNQGSAKLAAGNIGMIVSLLAMRDQELGPREMFAIIGLWKATGKFVRGGNFFKETAYFRFGRNPPTMETLSLTSKEVVLSRIQDLRNILNGLDKGDVDKAFKGVESAMEVFVFEFRQKLKSASPSDHDRFNEFLKTM
jgi:hypothetical protein